MIVKNLTDGLIGYLFNGVQCYLRPGETDVDRIHAHFALTQNPDRTKLVKVRPARVAAEAVAESAAAPEKPKRVRKPAKPAAKATGLRRLFGLPAGDPNDDAPQTGEATDDETDETTDPSE